MQLESPAPGEFWWVFFSFSAQTSRDSITERKEGPFYHRLFQSEQHSWGVQEGRGLNFLFLQLDPNLGKLQC